MFRQSEYSNEFTSEFLWKRNSASCISMLHKIGECYLSDHGRQPQFGQNAIFARTKAKIRNWKIINCFFIYMCQTLFTDKK